jgi:hypothetical protein
VDEGGNQKFGFYRPDYTPRLAGVYLHNLTTILADDGASKKPDSLAYAIPNAPETVHDLLLRKSGGAFELVIWDERVKGSDDVTVQFDKAIPAAKLYDPTKGTDAIRTLDRVKSISLTLSDHPVVIEISAKR